MQAGTTRLFCGLVAPVGIVVLTASLNCLHLCSVVVITFYLEFTVR